MSKWTPGCESPNPDGARKHKGPSVRGRLRAALLEAAPDVVAKLILQARAGDPVALKMFLDRVLPTLRPTAEQIELDIKPGTLMQRAEAVLALAAAGEIPLDAASEFISNATKLVAIEEGTELKNQLALLLSEKFGNIA